MAQQKWRRSVWLKWDDEVSYADINWNINIYWTGKVKKKKWRWECSRAKREGRFQTVQKTLWTRSWWNKFHPTFERLLVCQSELLSCGKKVKVWLHVPWYYLDITAHLSLLLMFKSLIFMQEFFLQNNNTLHLPLNFFVHETSDTETTVSLVFLSVSRFDGCWCMRYVPFE